MAGLAVSVAGLALALAPFLQPPPPTSERELADILAETLRGQWDDEVGARRLRDPSVIPLVWSATERSVADTPNSIAGSSGTRIRTQALEGRLHGSFDEAIRRLGDGYRQIPSGRLVVLGEPGAGKTVLAIMLVLGLLGNRESGVAVPVLLSVSSWDPVSESLDDWIVQSLATAYYNGRPEVPRRLLDRRLLLPVLDGLDEMPESARRSAVRGINLACGDGRGVVVTCRSTEYEDVIAGGAPVLRRAPVVEVRPVPASDARAYLSAVDWPEATDWSEVYERLETEPDSAVSTALSTPLMLSLARTVYQHCPEAPAGLLDHGSRHEVEDHLVDRVIVAAYAPRQAPGELSSAGPDWRVQADEAERWLTYLARYLHQYRERDLTWWLMSGRLLSLWAGPAIGIGLGMIVLLGASAMAALMPTTTAEDVLATGAGTGGGFAVLAMFTWFAAPERPPGRLSFAVRGSLGRLRRGYATGLALTAIPALPLMAAGAVTISIDTGWSADAVRNYFSGISTLLAVASSIGLALAVHNWLDAPPERSSRADPLDFLVQDRKSSLTAALCAGTTLSLSAVPLLAIVVSADLVIVAVATGWSHEPIIEEAVAGLAFDDLGGLLVTMCLCGAGTVLALLVLLTRAWPRFLLTRLVLAAQRRLPWRLMGFLADARLRQLLRQSGGTYQFRHVRLQERLASRSLAEDREPPDPSVVTRRRRRLTVTVAVVIVALCLILSKALPSDTSQATSITGDIDGMVLSPDGSTAITLASGEVTRWKTETGVRTGARHHPRLPSAEGPSSLTQTAAGRIVAYQEGTIHAWDADTGEHLGHPKPVHLHDYQDRSHRCEYDIEQSVTLSGDGTRLALEGRRCLLVWDVVKDAPVALAWLPDEQFERHIALNEDGTRLTVCSPGGLASRAVLVRRWDLAGAVDADDVPTIDASGRSHIDLQDYFRITLSGDGTRLAASRNNEVRVWDTGLVPGTGRGRKVADLTGHVADVNHLALSEDGSTLAATAEGTARFWTAESWR
ncbi:NACHT domain-containing protein [Streptomyces sp. WAC04114]|uniref:NACHT and WD40 repeat domain-containing protein n=1 Tax=Streptomyces sp. WAC04114 TaxID=2867961 RepID=UPI001C8C9E86|nr:NACHT domain-containing protein [Streptomyces sp. WAC04114]MBX9361265.1 NACHT domain-containing protein [Streptomyces sp. WAC04114]